MLRKSFCEQKSWIESDIYEQTNKWKLNAFFAKLVWSLTCLANIQKFEHHYLIEIFVKNHDLALYKVMISRNIFQRTVNFLFFCTTQFYQKYFKVRSAWNYLRKSIYSNDWQRICSYILLRYFVSSKLERWIFWLHKK